MDVKQLRALVTIAGARRDPRRRSPALAGQPVQRPVAPCPPARPGASAGDGPALGTAHTGRTPAAVTVVTDELVRQANSVVEQGS